MKREEVVARLTLLAEADTEADDAVRVMGELDEHALEAVPWVYQWLHEASTELEVHAATRVLGRWLDRPLAGALAPALRVMLREPEVSDLSKLAAAALLERMGRPVDDLELQSSLADVHGLAGTSLRAALASADTAAAAVHLIEAVGEMPVDRRVALTDDLVRLRDRRAAIVLGPMTHDVEARVAIAAIAAIELLGLDRCAEHVSIAAGHHPDAAVREQAALTLGRLPSRGPDVPVAGSEPTVAGTEAQAGMPGVDRQPLVRALVGAGAGSGARVVVLDVARSGRGDGGEAARDVLTVVVGADGSAREYAVAERLSAADVDALVGRFAEGGVALAPEAPRRAAFVLRTAAAGALAAGGTRRLGFLVWPLLLPTAGPAST